ncbi:MAG: 16S rRNA (cytidine(1402)-2'-O)-methyltransferase [Bacillota bacterium]|nr:16S rRNA (cytidine(1402)-2'-O)-methyltransferase [Bacillota bacterium]
MEKKDTERYFGEGTLYICGTPIGNLKDITLRSLEYLKKADFIAVESINHSRKLLSHYGIRAPLISFRESNREKRSKEILHKLRQGASVAFITDAGMPTISDPGTYLVNMAIQEQVSFTVLPGPSAVLTALIKSGYSGNKFVFWGFLSRKAGNLKKEIQSIAEEEKTGVIYEAPHRLVKTLKEMGKALKGREVAVCRELTKKFEEVRRGTADDLFLHYSEHPPRGEITIVISSVDKTRNEPEALKEECITKLMVAIQKGITPREAVKQVAESLSLRRNEVYKIYLELQKN